MHTPLGFCTPLKGKRLDCMIKLIATDMDGTFLTDANDYDRQRFVHVFEALQAQGKRFVAISGNQYDQIKDFSKTTLTR